MWPRTANVAASESDDSASEASEDFSVLVESDATERTRRLEALSDRVGQSGDRSDMIAIASQAKQLHSQAENDHRMITFAARFTEAFMPDLDSYEEPFLKLGQMMFQSEDAQHAWQTAADHYHAAVAAAHKIGLAVRDVGPLDKAAGQCDAQAARLAVKTELLRAVLQYKQTLHRFREYHARAVRQYEQTQTCSAEDYVRVVGQYKETRLRLLKDPVRACEMLLDPLRRALAHSRVNELHAIPLAEAPLEGFDLELRNIVSGTRDMLEVLLRDDPLLTVPANENAAWLARLTNSHAELHTVTSALRLALRGELAPDPAPGAGGTAPVPTARALTDSSPTTGSRAVEAPAIDAVLAGTSSVILLNALRAGLAPTLARVGRLHTAAEATPIDESNPLESHSNSTGAWHDAAHACDDAVREFDDATRTWTREALSNPATRQMRTELCEARGTAVRHMRDAITDIFSTMSAQVRAMNEPEASGKQEWPCAAHPRHPVDLIQYCETLQHAIDVSDFLKRAGDLDAGRLSAPFVALAMFLRTMLQPHSDAAMMRRADTLRETASIAAEAMPACTPALDAELHRFSDLCVTERMTLLWQAFHADMEATTRFSEQQANDAKPATERMHALRDALPLMWFDDSPAGRLETQQRDAADSSLSERSRVAAQAIDGHVARMTALPADAPESMRHMRDAILQGMRAYATVYRATAELIECGREMRGAIGVASPSRRATALRRLAARAKAAGASVGNLLADQQEFVVRGADSHLGNAAEVYWHYTLRTERTVESIQTAFDVLAQISDAEHHARELSRQPILTPRGFLATTRELAAYFDRARDTLIFMQERLKAKIGTSHADAELQAYADYENGTMDSFVGDLLSRTLFEINTTQRMWNETVVRTLAARLENTRGAPPEHAAALLGMIDGALSVSGRNLSSYLSATGNRERVAVALGANVELGREVQRCRDLLNAREASRQAARSAAAPSAPKRGAGAEPSRSSARKSRKGT